MSKGPGRWQRLILAELARREAFYLKSLLPPRYTNAQYKALHRAAVTLYRAGKVEWQTYWYGRNRTVICRPGYEVADRRELDKR